MYVAEIFKSIHGEVNGHHQGRLVGFIRLSGCNLTCSYCDTPETMYAFYGKQMSIIDIVSKVAEMDVKHVCITGGEPLLKMEKLLVLLSILHEMGLKISIETNGTMDIAPVLEYVESVVVDWKFEFPEKMKIMNFTRLRSSDVVKFVVGNEQEFKKACLLRKRFESEGSEAIMAVSPLVTSLKADELAQMVIDSGEDNLLLSLQIHKILKLK